MAGGAQKAHNTAAARTNIRNCTLQDHEYLVMYYVYYCSKIKVGRLSFRNMNLFNKFKNGFILDVRESSLHVCLCTMHVPGKGHERVCC